jgi:hypothetical protein
MAAEHHERGEDVAERPQELREKLEDVYENDNVNPGPASRIETKPTEREGGHGQLPGEHVSRKP